jgi:tRNA threonylcarbamoyladenosine biosynthesis protein TsaE
MNAAGVQFELRGEAAQEAFGRRLAEACDGPMLIFLEGDLGAGKTTLTRGFLHGLGHSGAVKSPTYTLIEPYEVDGRHVYHLDLYRVGDPGELEYLGLREMLAEDAVILVEWAERGEGWLPPADLRIRIAHRGDGRSIRLDAGSERGHRLLAGLPPDLQ